MLVNREGLLLLHLIFVPETQPHQSLIIFQSPAMVEENKGKVVKLVIERQILKALLPTRAGATSECYT